MPKPLSLPYSAARMHVVCFYVKLILALIAVVTINTGKALFSLAGAVSGQAKVAQMLFRGLWILPAKTGAPLGVSLNQVSIKPQSLLNN